MNLEQTVNALVNVRSDKYPEGVLVDSHLGVHAHCLLDSNCPLAFKMRQVINESGISAEELLAGVAKNESGGDIFPLLKLTNIDTDVKVSLDIAGKRIETELPDLLSDLIKEQLSYKLSVLNEEREHINNLAKGYNRRLVDRLEQLSKQVVLPQLGFSMADMTRYGCVITSRDNNYLIAFPFHYHPEYIYNNGNRYELSDIDKAVLVRNVLLVYTIAGKTLAILDRKLINKGDGNKFSHYHGRVSNNTDCWGTGVKLVAKWDTSLVQLLREVTMLSNMLTTINYNSLYEHTPLDMPYIDTVLASSKKMGKEGEIKQESSVATPPPTPRAGWGRAGRR